MGIYKKKGARSFVGITERQIFKIINLLLLPYLFTSTKHRSILFHFQARGTCRLAAPEYF